MWGLDSKDCEEIDKEEGKVAWIMLLLKAAFQGLRSVCKSNANLTHIYQQPSLGSRPGCDPGGQFGWRSLNSREFAVTTRENSCLGMGVGEGARKEW